MHFEGEFRVPGTPSEVIRRFEDVPRMASCMPGAVLEPQAEDGSWPGKMIVAFGPKKVAFKGKVTCGFDQEACTGTLQGRGTADMRAARIGVKVSFALHPDPTAPTPTTVVKIVSDAELGGVLADFARTGGVAVARVIMADFARRASEEFAKDAPDAAVPEPAAVLPRPVRLEAAGSGSGATAGAPVLEPRVLDARGETVPHPADSLVPALSAEAAVGRTGPAVAASRAAPLPSKPAPAALSATGLLWAVMKAQFLRLAQRLGLAARDA